RLRAGGRRFLVLGDLLELGESSARIHEELGREVARDGRFAGLVTVGPESRRAASAASEAAAEFAVASLGRVEEVADRLVALLAPGDLVLFKASRGVALDRAVEEVRRRLASRAAAGTEP